MRKYLSSVSTICFLSVISAFLISISAPAQTPVTRSLIVSPIDEGVRVPLRGNVHPLAQAKYDVGAAPDSARADRMMLILKRSPQQDAALASYLADVQDPGSAEFHRFLTPEEFGTRFGVSDADAAQVQGWLKSHGFSVAGMNKGRTAIEFSGTVGQVQETFHTAIHRFAIAGVQHLANVSDPEIPAALAAVVGGVSSLNDFKPQPNVVMGPRGKWDPTRDRFVPELTISVSGTQYLFLGPGDAATIYNAPNSLNTHLAAGQTPYDGTGVTIGIAGTTILNDFDTMYRILFGLDGIKVQGATTVYDGNYGNFDQSESDVEAAADVQIAGALAPGANVIYYAAGDTAFESGLFLAIYRAIDDNNISILNVSYGACEAALGTAGNLQVLNAWQQAAAQGITVTVSSGDSGSAGCDNPNLVTAASHGFGVNGLASTPYNVAVGGTDFDDLSSKFATYVGANSSNFTSALSYIPERPWNDSTTNNGALSSNSAATDGAGDTSIWAGGGGKSSAATGSGGYAKPAWQKGFSPANTDLVRDLPDVSLFSGGGHYHAVWALCLNTDCSQGAGSSIHGVGGTSTSSPAMAGILALVSQKTGTRLGQANWVLYKLAQTTPSIFHGITNGNISVYCKAGSANCGSNNFLTGYNAQANYSMATGLGSVDATLLVNHWGDDARSSTSTTLSLDKTTFAHGTPVTLTAGVNPTSATGSVAITENYAAQSTANPSSFAPTLLSLSAGTASGSYSQFPGGTYNVYAGYAGDGTHTGSISQPVKVTVSPEDSVLNFSVYTVDSSYKLVDLAGKTVPLGTFISVNAQPIGVSQSSSTHPVTNATGKVYFQDVSTGHSFQWGDGATLDSTGNAESNTTMLEAGSHSITGSYDGDLSYNPSTAGPVDFTITPIATSISLSADAATTIGQQVQLNANISANLPPNAPFYVHGTVTFTDTTNNTVLGTASDIGGGGGCQGAATFCAVATLQVDSTQLHAGDSSIVASFSGDINFNPSGNSAPVKVTCEASCWNAAGQRLELAFYPSTPSGPLTAGQSSTTPVGLLATNAFTGDVNFTCSVAGKKSNDAYIPTCSFDPAKVTITGTQSVQTTLKLSTTAPTKSALAHPWVPWGRSAIALGGLLLCLMPARRFRRKYLAMIALLAALGWMTACGGGSTGSSGGGGGGGGGGTSTGGTTPDTYTVTFKAADAATGTVTAEDYFNFIVE